MGNYPERPIKKQKLLEIKSGDLSIKIFHTEFAKIVADKRNFE
jgi:hypothetical protein